MVCLLAGPASFRKLFTTNKSLFFLNNLCLENNFETDKFNIFVQFQFCRESVANEQPVHTYLLQENSQFEFWPRLSASQIS
jgi:hypothetical protein